MQTRHTVSFYTILAITGTDGKIASIILGNFSAVMNHAAAELRGILYSPSLDSAPGGRGD